jgi:acyl-CoA synthetase (NDP forming)
VAIVTSSGGAGALAADACERRGLGLATLKPATVHGLRTLVPDFGSLANPVDITAQVFAGDPTEALARIVEAVAADAGVGQVLLVLTNSNGAGASAVAERLVHAPMSGLHVCFLGSPGASEDARAALSRGGVPSGCDLRSVVDVMAALATEAPLAPSDPPTPIEVDGLFDEPVLTEGAAAALLDRLGIGRPASWLVADPSEAEEVARGRGVVVLKVDSPDLLHKTEAGAVRVGVAEDDVRAASEAMLQSVSVRAPGIKVRGILVQDVVGPGVELLVSARGRVDGYPAVVTVGMGGTAAEVLGDIATGLAPLSPAAAKALLLRLRSAPLLTGHRDHPGIDLDAVAGVVSRLSMLAWTMGEALEEIEINPLVAHGPGQGATAVDFVGRRRPVSGS